MVGHESNGPQVVFNVCQSHRHDSTHPSLFYRVRYHSYICGVQHIWAKSCITLWSNAGRMVTHPCINWACDCLTSVIKCKMFAPCYVSPLCVLWEGQSYLHDQITLLVFSCSVATGAFKCMFWEILQKLPELQSTENVDHDSIL